MDGPHSGGGGGGSSSTAPFLTKTYDMIDDPSTDWIVSWSHSNSSFVVLKPAEFARDLLPKYFKHNNFSSFVRQLNTYGFRKIDPDQWEFANEEFIRGKKYLLKNIHRRKPIHSHSLHHQGPLAEAERQDLQEEIDKLKNDKNMLILELQKHTQQQHGMERQIQGFEDRLQKMEQHQKYIIGAVTQAVHRPGFLSNLVQTSDLQKKKRRLPKMDYFLENADVDESQQASFRSLAPKDASDGTSMQIFDMDSFEKMESSINSLENFFHNVSQLSGGDSYYDIVISSPSPPTVVITEINASSGNTDVNLRSPSPSLGDMHSSPQLTESTSHVESPSPTLMDVQTDSRCKISEIDVNSEPTVSEVHRLSEQTVKEGAPAAPVNDVFWEQFLTEAPGSTETQEVQSDRRDVDKKISDGKLGERGTNWWNRKNVDNLAEQMGHLTPAGKI